MRGATLGSLILFVVMLATACSSGGTDQPTDPTVTPTPGRFATAAAIELDPAPDLPGEYVNLPEIYQDERGLATYGSDGSVPNTAPHVTRDVDYAADGNSNPPAGGPHWSSGSCGARPGNAPPFCGPAPWGIFREPWVPATLVHNMEHGGVIFWYDTQNSALITELEDLVRSKAEDGDLLVMAPYPEMEDETIALTSWARIDKFPVGEYTKERVEDFLDAHAFRFNPEGFGGF